MAKVFAICPLNHYWLRFLKSYIESSTGPIFFENCNIQPKNGIYQAAQMLLSAKCIYNSKSGPCTGPTQIIESYKGNGDRAAATFDSIRYESHVEPDPYDGWIITFTDHVHHKGKHLIYKCRQSVRVDQAGLIHMIEHRDIPGEKEKLEGFLQDVGITRLE